MYVSFISAQVFIYWCLLRSKAQTSVRHCFDFFFSNWQGLKYSIKNSDNSQKLDLSPRIRCTEKSRVMSRRNSDRMTIKFGLYKKNRKQIDLFAIRKRDWVIDNGNGRAVYPILHFERRSYFSQCKAKKIHLVFRVW